MQCLWFCIKLCVSGASDPRRARQAPQLDSPIGAKCSWALLLLAGEIEAGSAFHVRSTVNVRDKQEIADALSVQLCK